MRQYELTYLISDNVPESDLNKVTGKVGGYVTTLGGKILKEEIWGRRKLAYPIKKQEFATYVTLNFELPSDKANEFEHNIFMSSKIIRHLMLVQDYGAEELTLTQEDIAENEEIKEVIGGEKSFEAVEGETEESKDLMAVRGEEEKSSFAETTEDKEEAIKEVKREEASPKEETKEKSHSASPYTEVTEDKKASRDEEKAAKPASKKEAVKKPAKTAKKVEKKEDEADRLSKLDKELDDILGDDLK